MRRFIPMMFGASILVMMAACAVEKTGAPIEKSEAKQANTCRSGWVVRTGADGQPDSTCADAQ